MMLLIELLNIGGDKIGSNNSKDDGWKLADSCFDHNVVHQFLL